MSDRAVRVWIDADAAPREAKEVVFRAARRLKFETILVANQSAPLPLNAPTVRAITVSHGANVADKFILDESEIGDIVVTADIPMAALLVAKGVYVIDPRGEEYTPDNIQGRESVRNFMDDLRGAGIVVGRNRPYDARNKKEFASAFDRVLTRALRRQKS